MSRRFAFVGAVVLWTATSVAAQLLRSHGSIAAPITVGLLIAGVLLWFGLEGHKWPRWVIATLLLTGASILLAGHDRRSPLAIVNLVAVGWLSRNEQRFGSAVAADAEANARSTDPWSVAVRVSAVLLGASFIVLLISGVPLFWTYRPSVGRPIPWERSVHRFAGVIAEQAALAMLLTGFGRSVAQRRWPRPTLVSILGVWTALVLALLTWFESFTGYLLPWGQLALRAVTVGTKIKGIDEAAFGHRVRFILIGGAEIAQTTYRLWAIVHLVVLPVAIIAVLITALWRGRRIRTTP